jgi:hypothetical protein
MSERIASLIAALDHDRFAVREDASRQLAALGESAGPMMRQALAGRSSLEVRRRLEELLDKPRRDGPSAEWLRTLRALAVLERTNTPEARRVLETLAKGAPEMRLTQEAENSLSRLARRRQQS